MKKCIRCGEVKLHENFNFKNKLAGLRGSHCKNCSRTYLKSHYYKNRGYYLIKAKIRNALIRNQIRKYIRDYLSIHPCIDCGENDPDVLEFDHVRDKKFLISRSSRTQTLEAVISEVAKCEIRCANCHRRITARRLGWSRHLPL